MDAGESAEQCAVRELKEETGYVGTVVGDGFGVSPVMFNGEWISWMNGMDGWVDGRMAGLGGREILSVRRG